MDCFSTSTIYESSPNPYCLLFQGISLIPLWHYLIASLIFILLFLYNFIEFHFFEDLLTGFRGYPVLLTFNPRSHIYDAVVSKCSILHARYLATPWLSSPHVQTVFLGFFGRPPVFSYRREIFQCSDGGTIALDWLSNSDALKDAFLMNSFISKDDTTPIVVVVPGLTSDSASAYLKHFAFHMEKSGWHVVISNHRGLGGVSITSDCFYNAGWTEDVRAVVRHLHSEYPKAPLFVVGTSIGANVLVKYLGEDGDDVPIAGAVAICSPWDLLVSLRRKALPRVKQPIGDRFISRRLVQKFYDRALAIGLQGYAQLHQPLFSRLANWEGIEKSRSIRDFDNHATRLVGKYETVDTYYRRCSSASYVGNVSIPLLCISALDDPVCTREAIPWDECRANKNIVLATTKHGGHLAFFEGISASSLWYQGPFSTEIIFGDFSTISFTAHLGWWVRAVIEYLKVLHSSEYMHVQKKVVSCGPQSSLDSSIDQGPFVNVTNGMVVAMSTDQTRDDNIEETSDAEKTCEGRGPDADQNVQRPKQESDNCLASNTAEISRHITSVEDCKPFEATLPVRRCLDLLRQQNRFSMWLLAYVALVTSWPLLGSIFQYFRKKRKNLLLPGLIGR